MRNAVLLAGFLAVLGIAITRQDAAVASTAPIDSLSSAHQDSINRAQPGYVIDSILPIEEELRRFRAIVGPEPKGLIGGFDSVAGVVKAFAAAVETRDTVALNDLTISQTEFAWLVYPSSPFMRPPYRQPPGLLWMSIHTPSDAAKRKLLARFAGKPLGLAGFRCEQPTERQGENVLHPGCVLELIQESGAISRTRLFGTVIERRGTFKLVSFDNDL